MKFSELVPIPGPNAINTGLEPCGTLNALRVFGVPGRPTRDCSPITNAKIKRLLVTRDVGPFNVTGIGPAVDSLTRIFERVRQNDPALFQEVKTAGMLCNRLIRGSNTTYSIHSFGSAIDLYFGAGVVPLGSPFTHYGVLKLYPYFQNEGWYWGAEFARNDAMHLEISRGLLFKWQKAGMLS